MMSSGRMESAVAAILTHSFRLVAVSPVVASVLKLASKFFSCTTRFTHMLFVESPCTYSSVR